MLYIMLAAAYPFGRPEDERLKPSRKMHVMLQVGLSWVALALHRSCPHPACTLSACSTAARTQLSLRILPRQSILA